MNVLYGGIDPSYTGTALVAVDGAGKFNRHIIKTKPAEFESHPERLVAIRENVVQFFDEVQPALICIEGYAHGAKFGREMAGELGGIIRVGLWEAGFSYADVAIGTLKMFVTGSGKAEKSLILREVFRKWKYEAKDDNDADAFGLAMFSHQMGQPKDTWTKKFAKSVVKIEIVKPCL